jgi:endonuclease/exonuclease/phosphatase family metal-dependent hydrolase
LYAHQDSVRQYLKESVPTLVQASGSDTPFALEPEAPTDAPTGLLTNSPDNEEQVDTQRRRAIKLISWNLYNFGKSKDDGEIGYMANVLAPFDLVAIQEVVTGPAGAQAIARLADELNRKGSRWDYAISDPTTGNGSERYAFLWKPSRVQLRGKAWLEQSLEANIDREPYLARFAVRNRVFLVASFHAVPSSKKPQNEIALLSNLSPLYPDDRVLLVGDFNLTQRHTVWDPIKEQGFKPILENQKTSLRMKEREGDWLANEYDNIFYEARELNVRKGGILPFYQDFQDIREARNISDHVPVWIEFIP